MNNEQLFIKFLTYVSKKLEYKKHIDGVYFYNIDINKKYYSFDIDIFENNSNYSSLHIDLLRGNIIKSNKLIKSILLSL
jgi:hypothetical protein